MLREVLGLSALLGLSVGQALPAPVVDLGYSKYQGYYDPDFDLNIYNGVRYAAPPVGKLRWQMPQPPAINASTVITAVEFAPQCPQVPPATRNTTIPDAPSGDEDCLFLNVMAPANGQSLPVLVWIHGGGYGGGNNRMELKEQIRTNGNSYIVVSIAYRLGAFGFLSSAEVAEGGILNAGIHDMRFALQWVRKNIVRFGGDPEQVTISGISAGGGGVMLLAMANGGSEGDALFKGLIPSSPYLPTQWDFDDAWPTLSYQAFVDAAGCADAEIPFECLQSADTAVLQKANAIANAAANYGQWAFIPVTDGSLIRKRPTEQLITDKKVNGVRMLSGSNANEGPLFTPQNITSKDDFVSFVLTSYPRLSEQNMTKVLELYNVPEDASGEYVNSNGLTPPFSTTNSNWAIGWQQAATNLYAETTFVCPSYWLADAFSGVDGKSSWKYQFSVPPAQHGADGAPLLDDPKTPDTGMDEVFRIAFQQIWGNFIVNGDPTLSVAQLGAADKGNIDAAGTAKWAQWGGQPETDFMLNLNMTGGTPVPIPSALDNITVNVTGYVSKAGDSYPELKADFTMVPGWPWEDGRGKRCQLWAELSPWALE